MLGLILMRFAAALFMRLLERFPALDASADPLVLLIGFKFLIDYAANAAHPNRVDFQDPGGGRLGLLGPDAAVPGGGICAESAAGAGNAARERAG